MTWLRAVLATVLASFLSLSMSVAQECKTAERSPFTIESSSHASTVLDTKGGKLEASAVRVGHHSARISFQLNGRAMTPVSLQDVPENIRACFKKQIREASGGRTKRKFYCYWLGDDAECNEHDCYATACCLVGHEQVCASVTVPLD
jgi:hypothetical protein